MLTSWALSIPPQRSSLDPCPPWAESSFHLQIFSNLYKYEFSQKANTNTNLSSSYSCPGETRPQKVHVAAILCQWILGFWGHLTDADYGGYLIASSVQLIPLNWAFDLLGGIGFYRFCQKWGLPGDWELMASKVRFSVPFLHRLPGHHDHDHKRQRQRQTWRE